MKPIKVAAVALNQTPIDWEGNLANIVAAIEQAKKIGATIICLPELCITGYGCEDAFFSINTHEKALDNLHKIRLVSNDIVVSVGLPIAWNNAIYNTACLIANNKILGFVPKQNLAADGVHYEPRWFKPWPRNKVITTNIDGENFFIGDIVFNVGGIKIGYEICEDAWVADRPGSKLSKFGVDIILNPSASHFALGKRDIRKQFVTEGSRAFRCVYIYANLLGNESGRLIFDGDTIIGTGGNIIAEGSRFAFSDAIITTATIDINTNRTLQMQTGSFRPEYENNTEIKSEFEFPENITNTFNTVSILRSGNTVNNNFPKYLTTNNNELKFYEFYYAVSLGLFDYMRKSNSNGFVISLSGGADSAAVACLVHGMRTIAVGQLGDRFAERSGCTDNMRSLLTCIYQRSANSSKETEEAAICLAGSLKARMLVTDIEPLVQQYIEVGNEFIGRSLNWEQDDIALQNIQARTRSPSAWLIANLQGALLLTTSNRSEAAVGYATMDGDTSGGLSPIGGIDKNFIKQWLLWLYNNSYNGLSKVIDLVPTAELRPKQLNQSDEQDLMPYFILDMIEKMAIRDKLGPHDVFKHLEEHFGKEAATKYTVKFFQLWSRNQWKRERFAVAFHLDDYNLDPKTACRFPILSGGFKQELKEIIDGKI